MYDFGMGLDCLVPKTNPNTIAILAHLRENPTTVVVSVPAALTEKIIFKNKIIPHMQLALDDEARYQVECWQCSEDNDM